MQGNVGAVTVLRVTRLCGHRAVVQEAFELGFVSRSRRNAG
jgi:hypothetical protein